MLPARSLLFALAGALALAGAGCAGRSAAPYEQGDARYEFKFMLTRAPGESGACAASASLHDRMADRRIVIPVFTAPWGVTASASASDSAYGARFQVDVTVDGSGTVGLFAASLRRDGQLIASRTASQPVSVRPSKTRTGPG
jgi:hypothetical protein